MLLDKRMRGSRIRIHPFGQRERSRGTFVDRSIQRRSPARPKVASGALEAGGIPASKEKPPPGNRRGFQGKDPGDDLLSHAECTLPSAHMRFTSEFGM
ncbi:hypothetical protein LDO11_13675, partial [Luteimonas sp. MHLX1A]